jgi:hypothetical protein
VPSNTTTSVQSNETFSTSAVALAVGTLNTTAWNTGVAMNYAEVSTIVTGSPASFTILLEGSLDGQTWVTLVTLSNTAGETQWSTGSAQFLSLRARCTAVSGGTSPTVNVYVTTSQTPFQISSGGTSPASRVTVVGAVDTTQVVNRYASTSATGTSAAAPASGTAIATLAVFDFYYRVDVIVGFGGTAEATTADNFVLKAGGTTLYTLPAYSLANTSSNVMTFYVNPSGSVNLTVNVGGTGGSAGSIYKATIIATRLG